MEWSRGRQGAGGERCRPPPLDGAVLDRLMREDFGEEDGPTETAEMAEDGAGRCVRWRPEAAADELVLRRASKVLEYSASLGTVVLGQNCCSAQAGDGEAEGSDGGVCEGGSADVERGGGGGGGDEQLRHRRIYLGVHKRAELSAGG